MSKVSRESASQGGEYGPVTDRSEEIEGYSVNFTTFHIDMDQSAVLKGLPNDECQCPHWGYVVKGSMTMRSGDREEVLRAGDAYSSRIASSFARAQSRSALRRARCGPGSSRSASGRLASIRMTYSPMPAVRVLTASFVTSRTQASET